MLGMLNMGMAFFKWTKREEQKPEKDAVVEEPCGFVLPFTLPFVLGGACEEEPIEHGKKIYLPKIVGG